MRSLLAQIGDSTAELTKTFIESELTIRDDCDSLRRKVDIARETELENIHKASITLMVEIDAYEQECLSSWRKVKQFNEHVVEDVSKRMRAFIAVQQPFLQSVHENDYDLTRRLDEAKKLAQELSDRKMELKAAMFNDKLASFVAFPSMDEVTLGDLAFTSIQIPFKTLDITNNELNFIDFRSEYEFVLPVEHGQRIVTFKFDGIEQVTQMSCFDKLGRLIGSDNLECHVWREDVARCGPNTFVVCPESDSPKLSVYNSSLHRVRSVECKSFLYICCNSKFVFGLLDTGDSYETDSEDDEPEDDNNDENDEQEAEVENSTEKIQVRHLDTLSKAFDLRVPGNYWIERIMADEHHVVAMSKLKNNTSSSQWFMSIFDLATCNDSIGGDITGARRGSGKTTRNFFLADRHVHLDVEAPTFGPNFVLFDGWLVFPNQNRELIWFDKTGKRSETSTPLDTFNLKDIYSFGSSLIFVQHDGKLLLKR